MAKGNMFLGMSRGSVGDVTFYRGRGQQLARARNRNPKNPRSTAQIIQRMILATASKAYARLKSITNHSFQGVSYGAESQSFFLKHAMEDIRNWVASTLPITGEYPAELRDPRVYVGLAEPTSPFQAGVGLLISQGTIPSIPAVLDTPEEGADPVVTRWGNEVVGETILSMMNAVGAVRGDQITILALSSSGILHLERIVIRADASDAELAAEYDNAVMSPAYDASKTILSPYVSLDIEGTSLVIKSNDDPIAYGIILSRKVGDVWERSTQRLVWSSDAGDYATTDIIAAEWMAGTAEIGVDSPYYLNNADL